MWRLLVEKAEMADLVITGSKPPTFTSKFEKHISEQLGGSTREGDQELTAAQPPQGHREKSSERLCDFPK